MSPSIAAGDIKGFSALYSILFTVFHRLCLACSMILLELVSVYVARIYSKTECRGLEEGGKCDLTLP